MMMYSCFFAGPSTHVRLRQPVPADMKDSAVAQLEQGWRRAFLAKVYGILGCQLFVTVVTSFVMMQYGGRELIIWSNTDGAWVHMASLIGMMGSLMVLVCNRHKHPLNLMLLLTFTVTTSFYVGIICTSYAAAGRSALVVEAFAITSVVFIALTAFTLYNPLKLEFSYMGNGLAAATFALVIWGFFLSFAFESFVFYQVYVIAGVILFALWIVYDTHMLSEKLSYDEHILGAINLYLDFINFFLFILQCISGERQ